MSGFVVGAKVAVMQRYSDRIAGADTVAKIYKNGNIVLVGEPGQQWSPSSIRPVAYETGERSRSLSRRTCELWDAARHEKMVADEARQLRWDNLRRRLNLFPVSSLTDAMLDAIQAAIPEDAA